MTDTDNDLEKAYKSNQDAFSRRKTDDGQGNKNSNIKEHYNYRASKGSEADSYKLQSSSSKDETSTSSTDISIDARKKSSSSIGSVSQDEVDSKKPFNLKFIPPPYLKPKSSERKDNSLEEPSPAEKPKPKSVRRRSMKPPPGHEANGSDEEERIMDGLLMHYSKKRSPYESGKPKSNPKSSAQQKDDEHVKMGIPPARASSMPPETTAASEAKHGHTRATSLQPGMLSTSAHVHPKLPEYDDLAARIAALRGA